MSVIVPLRLRREWLDDSEYRRGSPTNKTMDSTGIKWHRYGKQVDQAALTWSDEAALVEFSSELSSVTISTAGKRKRTCEAIMERDQRRGS